MRARLRRDFDAVEEIGNRILAANAANDFVQRALARQFDELGNPDRAVPHWQTLRDNNPRDFEAAFHLARARSRAGDTPDLAAAKAAPEASGSFRGHLRAVLEEDTGIEFCDNERKNVVICGVSYSGSTLIDRLLGGLPETASIGESHWLTKAKAAKGYGPIDFDTENPVGLVPCTGCGSSCKVLNFTFRRHLAADHTNWFDRIAQQLGTRNLISADKNPPKIVDNDPRLRFDGLVVFKSLPQAWQSELNKRKAGESESYYLEECKKYVNVWTQNYRMFLEDFRPEGNVAFLFFDEFARDPANTLRAACNTLGLQFDEGVLSRTRPGHAIGGNSRALGKLKNADYAPEITPVESCNLPKSHIDIIAASTEATQLFDQLQAAYQKTIQHSARPIPDPARCHV